MGATIGPQLMHKTYEDMGEVQGAVAQRAEEVYARFKTPADQELSRRTFVQLVRPGEGSEDTRRRATFGELGEAARPIVKELADNRLVVTGRDETTQDETVELVHEALIRRWDRLRDWMTDDRAFRAWQERLRSAMKQWEGKQRDEDALLRGSLLAEAEQRVAERRAQMGTTEREYIQAGANLRNRENAAKERRRQCIVRWSITAAVLMTALMVISTIAAVLAFNARIHLAKTVADLEGSLVASFYNQLYFASKANELGRHDEAICWYLRAYQTAPASRQDLRTSARHLIGAWARSVGRVLPHDKRVSAVAFSPDGQWVLTGSWDRTARLWDARTGQPRGVPLEHEGYLQAVTFSTDGQTVLTVDTSTARLWDACTGQSRRVTLNVGGLCDGLNVALSPDGQTVVAGTWERTARLWDARTGRPRGVPLEHEGLVDATAFSPDGQTVLTGSEDKTARLWDAHTCQPRGEPLKHERDVVAGAFSPDGQRVLTGSGGDPANPESRDGTLRLWDARTGQPRGAPLKQEGYVNVVAFSPDGQTVLTVSQDWRARLWDVPAPALDEPERLQLSVEVRTGLYFDERGNLKRLSVSQWEQRRRRLDQLGGFCDVVDWPKKD